jgi:adhesin transport system outer membrane protein
MKLLQILDGAVPADLPTVLPDTRGLSINKEVLAKCGREVPVDALDEAFVIEPPPDEEAARYSLRDAIARATEKNPGYLAKYDALEAAAQAAKQAYAGYLPQLSVFAVLTHFDQNTIDNSGGRIEENRYAATLTLRQQLFSLQTVRNIQLAAKQENLEAIGLEQAQLDLELAVTQAYLNYLRAEELLNIKKQNREMIDRNVEVASTNLQLGQGSRVDFLRWEDERTKATMDIIAARADLAIARVLLNILLNRPGEAPFVLEKSGFSEDAFWDEYRKLHPLVTTSKKAENLLGHLVEEALLSNPLIRQHDIKISLQKTLIAKNTARYFPTIGFQANFNYKNELVEKSYFEEKNNTWSASGFIHWPLFEGTDRLRERRLLKARLSEAEFNKDAVSLETMGKVQAIFNRLISQADIVPFAARSRKLARESYQLEVSEYEAGKSQLVSLLDARENVYLAEINWAMARYDYYQTLAKLVNILGWNVSENNTTFNNEFYQRLEQSMTP